MRTRFLNIDYFATLSSAPVNFLNLSVPRLPPLRLYSFEENLLRLAPNADSILVTERLPIDSALGKFIGEVIPQNIEVDSNHMYGKDCYHDQSVFPACDAYWLPENDHEAAADDRHKRVGFDFIYFERPDPYALLGSARFSEEKETQIFTEVREVESSQKLVQPVLKMQYSNKLKESIYSVQNINLPYGMDQYTCGFEDDGYVHKQMHHETWPLLEVDDTSLRTFTDPSFEEQVLLLLEKTESQYVQEANPLIDRLEMLDSTHCDVIRFLSDHCLPRQGLESQLATLNEFTVMDVISTMETSLSIEENTNCFSPKNPFVFEEFKFHLVDLCQLYEVFFEKQPRFAPEICDWIFTEEMNFKKFDELIVSCELALVDETFRSLPVPILCDDNKRTSMNIIVEKKLSGLKPQSLSATDGIYLDWQLWEENKCNSDNYFHQRILRELQLDNINVGPKWQSKRGVNLIFDF